MQTFPRLSRNKILLAAGGLAVIIVAGLFYGASKNDPHDGAVQVRRGDVVEHVVVTGKTKPAQSVALAFDQSGRIVQVAARVGDHVVSGQTLAVTDQAELRAELLQNEASADSEQAALDQLQRGTRPEEIAIQQLKVANAEASVREATKGLFDMLHDSYTRSDDAVRNKIDQMVSNPRSANPQMTFLVSDSSLELSFEQGRVAIEAVLAKWQAALGGINPFGDLASASAEAGRNLGDVKALLEHTSLILNGLSPNPALTQATISGWRSDISTARASINTAITNFSSAHDALRSAEGEFALAVRELELDRAGSTKEDIAVQEAALRQAEAKASATEAALAKTILRSPINGVVTTQDAKVGEIASPNTPVVSVISESNLEVEANVPEVDIGKLKIANPVLITLDAFSGETFSGVVSRIDPAETIVDGVVNYKVAVQFGSNDPRLKSGLTANLSIETFRKTNVLVLPELAITVKDGGAFVQKLDAGNPVEARVEVGVRSQDGMVEIVSGVSEGDTVQSAATTK